MQKKVLVLGCGLVGKAIALDLASRYETTSADLQTESFETLSRSAIHTIQADLSDQGQLERLIPDYDLIIGALPGNLGFKTLESVIRAGKNIVDISFMPEDYSKLDDMARSNGVTAVVDCGVAPGMSNIILGYFHRKMKLTVSDVMWADFHWFVNGHISIKQFFHPLM